MNFPNDYGLHKHNMSDTAGIMTLQLRLERIQGEKKKSSFISRTCLAVVPLEKKGQRFEKALVNIVQEHRHWSKMLRKIWKMAARKEES